MSSEKLLLSDEVVAGRQPNQFRKDDHALTDAQAGAVARIGEVFPDVSSIRIGKDQYGQQQKGYRSSVAGTNPLEGEPETAEARIEVLKAKLVAGAVEALKKRLEESPIELGGRHNSTPLYLNFNLDRAFSDLGFRKGGRKADGLAFDPNEMGANLPYRNDGGPDEFVWHRLMQPAAEKVSAWIAEYCDIDVVAYEDENEKPFSSVPSNPAYNPEIPALNLVRGFVIVKLSIDVDADRATVKVTSERPLCYSRPDGIERDGWRMGSDGKMTPFAVNVTLRNLEPQGAEQV